jgi:hypothetical protein
MKVAGLLFAILFFVVFGSIHLVVRVSSIVFFSLLRPEALNGPHDAREYINRVHPGPAQLALRRMLNAYWAS